MFAVAGSDSFKCSAMYKQINRWKKHSINTKKAFQKMLLGRDLNQSELIVEVARLKEM